MCFCAHPDATPGTSPHRSAPLKPKGPDGWLVCTVCGRASEWKCPRCGDSYGSNLRGEAPFLSVGQHQKRCGQKDPCALTGRLGHLKPGRGECKGTKYPLSLSVKCLSNLDASLCYDALSYPYRPGAFP